MVSQNSLLLRYDGEEQEIPFNPDYTVGDIRKEAISRFKVPSVKMCLFGKLLAEDLQKLSEFPRYKPSITIQITGLYKGARTCYRSASISKPIVDKRRESSVGPSKENLKPRVTETKEISSHKQTNIPISQTKYPSIGLNPVYNPRNCNDYMNVLSASFNTLSLKNEKTKENYPIDYNKYYNNDYNHNFAKHEELAASTPNKQAFRHEEKSTNLSNRLHRQEAPSFRITSSTTKSEKSHVTQESKDHLSYSINSIVKPVYGSSTHEDPISVSAAASQTIMPKPTSLNLFSEDTMRYQGASNSLGLAQMTNLQQPEDFDRNLDKKIEKPSCSIYLEELPQKPVILTTNSVKKLPDAPEYQESETYTKAYSKNQPFERAFHTHYILQRNSILQCLFASEPFMQEIKDIKRPGEVTTLFREIYANTLAPRDPSETSKVRDLLKCLARKLEFELSRENDAHAFYITLIERLMEEEPSLDKFFSGEFEVTGECDGCGPINTFEESFTELALPSKKKCPKRYLGACVEFCFRPKRFECCKCHLRKIRKPTLICAPEILVLLSEDNVREDIRIEEMISIPRDGERIRYTLLGMVEYTGSGNYGHYTA